MSPIVIMLGGDNMVTGALDEDTGGGAASAPQQQEEHVTDVVREAARVPPDTPEHIQPTREPRWPSAPAAGRKRNMVASTQARSSF